MASPTPKPAASRIPAQDPLASLKGIDHIVVLMKENRSFDQMLGYLKHDGLPEVRGLDGGEVNYAGEVKYESFEWDRDQTVFHPDIDPSGKILDPCHSKECVAEQLAEGNGGFVANFLKTRKIGGKEVTLPPELRKVPMGYYTARHLPVYDHLARNFCVCDAWHSSIPGDTWPNRLFALAGRESEKVGYKRGLWGEILARLQGLPKVKGLRDAPIYDVEAFTRQLDRSQWRWYSQDPSTLRAADKTYRNIRDLNRDNFAYFDRNRLSWKEEIIDGPLDTHASFLDDCANGKLRQVSWIDPNFADLHVLHPNSNDDHPPADIKAGQDLVLEVYEALANSPNWENTLLVIVYDEHGGFYDHVSPPPPPVPDPKFATLGVRVPAMLIGPRVPHSVCHETFDHTSLIATILRRFAANPDAALARMPARVQHVKHLGVALSDEPRGDLPGTAELRQEMDQWRIGARDARRAKDGPASAHDGAGHDVVLHHFQEEFLKFALAMRDAGLPGGQP